MQSSPSQTAYRPQSSESSPIVRAPVFTRLVRFFGFILGLRARAEDAIVERYAGWGWNDAAERQMVDDIATMRSSRL
jgi:hypothetical protein